MVAVYVYFVECDECGPLSGPLRDHDTALGVSNNHNANKHNGTRKAYPVTEKIENPWHIPGLTS